MNNSTQITPIESKLTNEEFGEFLKEVFAPREDGEKRILHDFYGKEIDFSKLKMGDTPLSGEK